MKKIMYFFLVLYLHTSGVASVRVDPIAGKFGTLTDCRYGYNGCYTTPVNGFWSIGDIYTGFSYDLGVFKFALPSEISSSDFVNSAKIKGHYIYTRSGGGSAFFKIQRYANDNTTDLGASDHPFNASLTDVGIVEINHTLDYFSFDVTAGVAADLAAGKTYSSYLITAVQDANGTPLTANWGPDIYYMAMDAGWNDASHPHLDIDYTASPVVRVDPIAGKFGSLLDTIWGYNGCQTTPDAGGFIGAVGDVYNGFSYDLGVYKFNLSSKIGSSFVIKNAQINGYCYSAGTAYLKIQRYANDNTTNLDASDHPNNASLIDVAIVHVTGGYDNFSYFSFDVTSGVAADLAAGKTYSSFLITAVKDANGTPLDGTPEYYYTAIKAGSDDASRPHLDVTVEPLVLVDNGTYDVSIHNIVSGTPSTVEAYAAQQLQAAFQSAGGVTPQINPASPAPIEIRLGVADQFDVNVGNTSEHAYTVRRTPDNNIELVGNSTSAVMWAVDDFCKQVLHVSWPIANDVLVCDQPQSTIAFGQFCEVEAPDFLYRGWIIGDNTDGYMYNNLIGNWMAHNHQSTLYCPEQYLGTGQGDSYVKMTARGIEAETTTHSFGWLVPADVYYGTHPEYFPLIGGVRIEPADEDSFYVQLCISNPNLRSIILSKINQGFSDYPQLKTFGVTQNDGPGGWCQCANCVAMDGTQAGTGVYSNRLISFINSLANAIEPNHPGKYIGTLAYEETKPAPDINAVDNVAITFGTGGRNCMKKLTDPGDSDNAALMTKLNGWLGRAANVHLWDYYFFPNMDYCPMPYARTICEEYGELKALGLKGVCSETYPNYWPSMRILSYTAARAGWDTSLDFNDILDDYDYEAYGPAASYMMSYYLLYENRIYAHVPFMGNNGAPAQLFPAAFTSGDLTTLNGYLTSAAATVFGKRVDPIAGKFGTLVDARWGYNGCSIVPVNGYYSIGDVYNGFSYDLGVFKFALPSGISSSDFVNSAKIEGYYIYARSGGGSAFFKIQKYANDNTTDLGASDHPNSANLIDVGVVEINHNNDYFSFDVTAGVAADLAAGKTYSSYLITAVQDAQGTPLTADWGPDIYYMAISEGWNEASRPHLDITIGGSQANVDAVAEANVMFQKFKLLSIDPATIPGIGSNVVTNPGAESDTTGWLTDIYQGIGNYTFSISTTVAHSDSKSFKIQCTGTTGLARWYRTDIPVTVGKKYAARFWIRATGGAHGIIELYAPSCIPVGWTDSGDQWVQIVVPEFTATSSTLALYLATSGPGTVYFDDVFIAELVPTASSPSPANSATNVSITPTLSWTTGVNALSHDVYLGTSFSDVNTATHASAQYKGNQAGTTYAPGTLSALTTYYWRVDEVGSSATTKGIVWSFTTLMPTFVAAGSITSGTGTITPSLPASITTGDILLLFIETSNQAVSISNQNGGTWTQVTNSPQGTGTAAGTTGARLTSYWSRYNGTQGNPTVSDSGDHQMGRIIAIRGAVSSGNPWDVTTGGVEAASDTSGSIPGATTTVSNTLVVVAIASALPDATGTSNFSSWTNANLTSLTERIDNTVTAGNGGGIGIATGIKATAGAYGNTAVTLGSSSYKGMMSIAIKP